HRAVDLAEQAGDVGGIGGHASQRIRRGDDAVTLLLQPPDDPVPTGRVGEGAVHEHDRRLGVGLLGRLLCRIHRGTSCAVDRLICDGWIWPVSMTAWVRARAVLHVTGLWPAGRTRAHISGGTRR